MSLLPPLRRLPVVLVLAGSLTLTGFASARAQQEISPEHLATAREYVEMSDNANVYELALIDLGLNVLRLLGQQDPALLEPLRDVIDVVMREYMEEKTQLYNQFARIYAARFTHEELEAIVDFYGSDVGQKLLAQNPGINSDLQTVLRAWEATARSEFLARVRALLRAEGYDV